MRALLIPAAIAALSAAPAGADTVVALRTIRPGEVLQPSDLGLVPGSVAGASSHPGEVEGLEARQTLYQGQPVIPMALGPPALFERNEIVGLEYRRGGLSIRAEGRALDRGGVGDRVRVMNLASRRIVEGFVATDGTVQLAEMH